MKKFAKTMKDLTTTDLNGLRKQLRSHPVIQAQAKQNDITAAKAVQEAFDLWEKGDIEPVHDPAGKIIGFKPVENPPKPN